MTTFQARRWLQALLLVAIAAAAVHLIFVLRGRMQPGVIKPAPAPKLPLNREAYVVPKKLHSYDLASARQLMQQPVWVQEGYRYTFYPYDPVRRRADFQHEAGLLGPIEQLRITDVVMQPTPGAGVPPKPGIGLGGKSRHNQVLAVFDKNGKAYAVPVGTESGGSFQIYADEMFFYEDPQQLYSFWPAEVWQDIRNHQVKPGMNEIQADFAVGMGVPLPGGDQEKKVVKYPNGGRPLTVTYENGRAVAVK